MTPRLSEGSPVDLFATMVRALAPLPVILDTSGAARISSVGSRPSMVKVNVDEIGAHLGSRALKATPPSTYGRQPSDVMLSDWHPPLRQLAGETGIRAWWLTLGWRGAAARLATDETLEVVPPRIDAVNTTGAGDAFLAGLIAAGLDGDAPREAAAHAAAMAAALCEQDAPVPPHAARVTALRIGVSVT